MPTIQESQQEILDELALFQDWTERYEYVIGLGKGLVPLNDAHRLDEKLIRGCQSRVWLHAFEKTTEAGQKIVIFEADSDSVITKGIIALFVRVLSGHSAEEILQADMRFLDETGLREHLAPTRANALNSMVLQMKQAALGFVKSAT